MEQHLGLGTYAHNLRTALEPEDVDDVWVAVEYAPSGRWWERFPLGGLGAALRGRREVVQGLRTSGADVVVFNTQVPAVLGGMRTRRRPYVVCTDVTPIQYDQMAEGYQHRADRRGPLRAIKRGINRSVFQRAAALAPWSRWVADSLVDDYGVDRARIEVIPPGVDLARWQPGEHVDSEGLQVLFVGGDFERKGGPLLLDAVATLPHGVVEVHAVTRSSLSRRPGLHVHGGLSANDAGLLELYRTSDVLVLPSRSETFGIVAVEGAAAGLPVIATRIGGLAELVVDGATGMSVPPGDVGAIARALAALAADPELRRRMGAAGRRRAEREFDAAVNARRLLRLAERAADGTGAGPEG